MSRPRSRRHDASPLEPDPAAAEALRRSESDAPHAVLGPHPASAGHDDAVVVRAFHPEADAAHCRPDGSETQAMTPLGGGLFAVLLPGARLPLRYRLCFRFPNGAEWERDDPYRFGPILGEMDLYLFGEGTHRRLWEVLGARPCELEGVRGTRFAVWAPNARRVSVVGDFNGWDGRLYPMRARAGPGVFELFIPELDEGALYKFELLTAEGRPRLKTDPFAAALEHPPAEASRVVRSRHAWSDADAAWMAERKRHDPTREPLSIYEVHLGSWARREDGSFLSYREIAAPLAAHAKRLGFTHLELLPVCEHPFYGSWGYQVTGYFAPTARYGSPDDLRAFVDTCHREGLGVLLDWVPAHFPKDDFALRRFDGTALFEHEDPRRGEHPDWGTLIFDYGRNEVRNFLISNALYWLEEFHIDGLRVDAVASMLYLDYSRASDQWLPNREGGRENLEAIDFLRTVNDVVREEAPGALLVAEESTAWPGVTRATSEGGLGFHFKWNMGWMHDTLGYFREEPVYRPHHHDRLTFAMVYEHSERFVNPLSHDEVVHGKGSLLGKMPGDTWQRFSNLRALLAYQFTRPGKKLLFMGTELAPWEEWNHDVPLPWGLAEDADRAAFARFLEALGALYRGTPCLWRRDPDPEGFSWIDASDRAQSVVAYLRNDGRDHAVVVMNATPVPREDYRVGVPGEGRYRERFSSDDPRFGGSAFETHPQVETEAVPYHGRPRSIRLNLPPLGVLVLQPGA